MEEGKVRPEATAHHRQGQEGSDRSHVAYSIVPESGQGADLRASEVETAPAVTTEDAKQNDRGVRVVGLPPRRHLGTPYNRSDLTKDESPTVAADEPPMVAAFNSTGGAHSDAVYVKKSRPRGPDGLDERWDTDEVSPTLNDFDNSDTRAVTLVSATVDVTQSLATERVGTDDNDAQGGFMAIGGGVNDEDPLLPAGLDSNRYRACGNAVVVNVAEWLGKRIMLAVEGKI
jgi:hypothetical protein